MKGRTVYLTGATGYLGHEIAGRLRGLGVDLRPLGREQGIDLLQPFELALQFEKLLARVEEPVLIHAAAMSRFYECEAEPDDAFRANMETTGALASVLERRDARMVYVSTDLVFDGEHAPYDEKADARPSSIYGKSKLAGERMVWGSEFGLVIRIPLLWGPSFDGKRGASDSILNEVRAGRSVRLFVDEWRTPLHVNTAASAIVDLAGAPEAVGIRHIPGPERLSRYELGVQILEEAGLDPKLAEQASRVELPGPPRPRDCSLATMFGG